MTHWVKRISCHICVIPFLTGIKLICKQDSFILFVSDTGSKESILFLVKNMLL